MPHFRMADGRAFTDYKPSCMTIMELQKKYSIEKQHDFRQFLQKNADRVKEDLTELTDPCDTCPICKK